MRTYGSRLLSYSVRRRLSTSPAPSSHSLVNETQTLKGSVSINPDQVILVERSMVSDVVNHLIQYSALGFDTEVTAPELLRSPGVLAPHLLQLATNEQAFLFRPTGNDVMTKLKRILENPNIRKVGFNLRNCRAILGDNYQVNLRNYSDLAFLLRGESRGLVGLTACSEAYLGEAIVRNKDATSFQWTRPFKHYTAEMKVHAANDAYIPLKVFKAWVLGGKKTRTIQTTVGTTNSKKEQKAKQDVVIETPATQQIENQATA